MVSLVGPDGSLGEIGYDRLILTAGSVNKLLPIPGIADNAHGFRSIAEAMFLRDEITRQLELAAVAADPVERAAQGQLPWPARDGSCDADAPRLQPPPGLLAVHGGGEQLLSGAEVRGF